MEALPHPGDLDELLRRAATLPGLEGDRHRLTALGADYARGLEQHGSALVIALVGATGAGKSTLINALAGSDVAEEGVDRPTSRFAVLYAPDDAQLDRLAGPGVRVARYTPTPGFPASGHVFIDTPDFNSVEREHRARAEAMLEQADVAMVVMHKGSVAEGLQVEFLAPFASRRRLLFVLNFADQLGEEARRSLTGQIQRLAVSRLGLGEADVEVFPLSALLARRGEDPSGGMARLVTRLGRLAGRAERERVRRSNAAAALREIADRVGPALQTAEATLREAGAALEQRLTVLDEAEGRGFEERLAAARGHLAAEVRRRAAVRLRGPAGLWLRVSSLSAAGLGGAAVISRFSLPAGLAAASASTALSAARGRARASHSEQLASGSEDAEPTARAALSPVRALLSSRPGGAGLTEGLWDVETFAARRTECRRQAYRSSVGDGLDQAVDRWWRWARLLLLPLVQLPLLALVVDATWRLGRAYLEGRWLGSDYLLNLGALGLLVSVAGAALASLSLAGATRLAIVHGVATLESALAGLRRDILADLEGSRGDAREAARRLLGLIDGVAEDGTAERGMAERGVTASGVTASGGLDVRPEAASPVRDPT